VLKNDNKTQKLLNQYKMPQIFLVERIRNSIMVNDIDQTEREKHFYMQSRELNYITFVKRVNVSCIIERYPTLDRQF